VIKSSETTLKFSNRGKLESLSDFLSEYRSVVSCFVDLLWEEEKVPSLLPLETTSQVETWLSARMIQAAGKQASGIVRGTRTKQRKRRFMIDKLAAEGKLKRARKLQRIYDEISITKPDIRQVNPELDARFVKIDLDNPTSFDGWLTVGSIGNRIKLTLPFRRNKHFNKMLASGSLKAGVRISRNSITFMFELPDPEPVAEGKVLGIDIGQKTVLSCSDGFVSKPDIHGHDLSTITGRLARKQRGSKGFQRCCNHRKNYIHWSVNQLNLQGVRQVNLERIKNLRRGKKSSRRLSHWTYTEIFGKLESHCSEQGVLVQKVTPTYTSQRCSECGWTSKSNRKGKAFRCGRCGYATDADLNASRNIALPLKGISRKQLLQRPNRTGFYWLVEGQEPVVPAVK